MYYCIISYIVNVLANFVLPVLYRHFIAIASIPPYNLFSKIILVIEVVVLPAVFFGIYVLPIHTTHRTRKPFIINVTT